jgi:hypothetical protein
VQRELSEPALIKTNTDSISNLWRYLQMNIELVKQAADIYGELSKEAGFISLNSSFGKVECHVTPAVMKDMDNLQLTQRADSKYPFTVFSEIDGIKFFAVLDSKELADFPQFKEDIRAKLLKQLAELDKEEELA